MGVVFLTCNKCKRTFPDCGPFERCDEDWGGCGRHYCSDECAKLERPGHDRAPTWQEVEDLYQNDRAAWEALEVTCVDCRGALPNDRNIIDFLLKRCGMTRSEADAEYLRSAKDRSP